MKTLITLYTLLALTLTAAAQPPDTLWTRTFGGSNEEFGESMQQTSDGGYVIAGYTNSFGAGDYDVYLVKTDTAGNQVWQHTFGGSNRDEGWSVQQTSDGGYVIAGTTESYGAGSLDVYLIKTDVDGNQVWQHTFGGSGDDESYSVQQTLDGGYIITGITYSYGAGDGDVYLIKTDAAGNQVWQYTFGGSSCDYGISVQQTSDGGYVITGYTESYGAGSFDVYLIKTDASGIQTWQRTFGGSSEDCGYSVQQTSDGGYVITGITYSYGAGDGDVYLIKTDAAGNQVWQRAFGGSSYDYGISVQQTSDGGYVITGRMDSYGAGLGGVYLIKTDAAGNLVWQRTFGGSDLDGGHSVQQTTDGGYVIAGKTASYGAGSYDVYLIKTDAGGTPVRPGGEPFSLPTQFSVCQPYPNPFNPSTTIRFDLPVAGEVRLEVFDVNGRNVGAHCVRPAVGGGGVQGARSAPLQEAWYPAGTHEITFDGTNLPSGIYLYRLTATPSVSEAIPTTAMGKMVLLK